MLWNVTTVNLNAHLRLILATYSKDLKISISFMETIWDSSAVNFIMYGL